MDENSSLIKRRGPDDRTWYVVAEAVGMAGAEIPAGLLRSAGIPVYLFREAINSAIPVNFGVFGGIEIAVPEAFYADALALLEGEVDELPAGDEGDGAYDDDEAYEEAYDDEDADDED